MKLIKIETPEQFLALKKNDQILVEWTDFVVRHRQDHGGCTKVMHYYIYENKTRCDEIICRYKGNHYFNWKMYLGLDTPGVNTSQAMEIYQVVTGIDSFAAIMLNQEDCPSEFVKMVDDDFWDLVTPDKDPMGEANDSSAIPGLAGSWIHAKTGKTYLVVGSAINATNSNDGDVMVLYKNAEAMVFVREIAEFKQKFSIIKEGHNGENARN